MFSAFAIAIQEKPNLHLELYLRLVSVWKHTHVARLRVRPWINCALHPDTDTPLHEPIESSQENREHSATCLWFEFAIEKIRGQLFVEMSLMKLSLLSMMNVATLL